MNIFEQASRKALRFTTPRGLLTTEDLWKMPLQGRDNFDLDSIAKDCNAALKSVTDESFVVTTDHPMKAELSLKLEIIKHVIKFKLEERQARADAAAKAEHRQKLLAALEKKQDAALESMTAEELQAQLKALEP